MKRFLTAFLLVATAAFSAVADDVNYAFLGATEAYNRGDYDVAFKDMKGAAERGHAVAQYDLGLMYNLGRGVKQDYARAFYWYTMSVEQGVALAALNLGRLYATGEGVTRNYMKAYMWTSLAADSLPAGEDHDGAVANLKIDEAHLSAEQIATAKRLAKEWVEKHGLNRN